MSASLKIRQLESKISDLQNQHQLLLKERQQEIAVLLSAVDLAHLDDKTLVGGLLFLKEKVTTQNPMVGPGEMLVRNFCVIQNPSFILVNRQEVALESRERRSIQHKLKRLRQHINRLKSSLSREKHKIKIQQQLDRKARTRMLIQALCSNHYMQFYRTRCGSNSCNLQRSAESPSILNNCHYSFKGCQRNVF